MRKATLHGTTGTLVAVLLATAISMAVLRNTVFLPDEKEGLAHTHGGKEDHLPQATLGKELFENAGCSQCHFIDSVKTKIGPGLKGLFDRTDLPVSHRSVSEENVIRQLEDPYENMPSFRERLSSDEQAQIISYLKTL
jgi:cytochrome c2